jgi:hypothetical protein
LFWALSVHYGIANMDWNLSLENVSKCAGRYLDLDVVLHFDYTASIGVASGLYWIRGVSEPSPNVVPNFVDTIYPYLWNRDSNTIVGRSKCLVDLITARNVRRVRRSLVL